MSYILLLEALRHYWWEASCTNQVSFRSAFLPTRLPSGKMHKAHLHVFFGSFLCLGPSAQNDASNNWYSKYEGHRSCACKDTFSHKIDGQHVDFVFQVFPWDTSRKIIQEVQDRACKKTGSAENDSCTPANFPHRIIFTAMVTEVECGPNPERKDDQVVRHAKHIASYTKECRTGIGYSLGLDLDGTPWKNHPGYLCCHKALDYFRRIYSSPRGFQAKRKDAVIDSISTHAMCPITVVMRQYFITRPEKNMLDQPVTSYRKFSKPKSDQYSTDYQFCATSLHIGTGKINSRCRRLRKIADKTYGSHSVVVT